MSGFAFQVYSTFHTVLILARRRGFKECQKSVESTDSQEFEVMCEKNRILGKFVKKVLFLAHYIVAPVDC